MTCDRCFKDTATGEHGLNLCPYESRNSAAAAVIGDEIDVTIRHGLCLPNGEPQRFRSRAELKRQAEARGFTNVVEHVPQRGSDKSPHTSRWI